MMNRATSVRAAFVLLIGLGCPLGVWAQQAGASGDPAMPSQLSALLARANANAGASTGQKSSTVAPRAQRMAPAAGSASMWGTGKSTFGSANQPLGIWRDGAAPPAAPVTASATIPGVTPSSGLSMPGSTSSLPSSTASQRSSMAASDLSTRKNTGLTQPAGFKPVSSPSSTAGRTPTLGARQGTSRGGSSMTTLGSVRSGGRQLGSTLPGRGGLTNVSGSKSAGPDFRAHPMSGIAELGGTKKSARAGARRTGQRERNLPSGLTMPREMQPPSAVVSGARRLPTVQEIQP